MIALLDHPLYSNKSINKVPSSQVHNKIQGNKT